MEVGALPLRFDLLLRALCHLSHLGSSSGYGIGGLATLQLARLVIIL
jgi:hypothetical protein